MCSPTTRRPSRCTCRCPRARSSAAGSSCEAVAEGAGANLTTIQPLLCLAVVMCL
jgi:hypothetical protein